MNSTILLSLIGFLILAPAQKVFCDEPKHNFAQWEKEISAFEAKDRTNPPPQHAILFIGSSTIRFWTTLAQDFPGEPVINRGFGGSEILDSTHFADRILFPYAPKTIFFRAGGNDIAAGKPSEAVFQNFKDFVALVHSKLPDAQIFFIGWNPTVLRWNNRDKEKILNDSVKEFASQTPYVKYIETSDMVIGANGKPRPELFRPDGLHFNADGYKLLVERVRPYLPKPQN